MFSPITCGLIPHCTGEAIETQSSTVTWPDHARGKWKSCIEDLDHLTPDIILFIYIIHNVFSDITWMVFFVCFMLGNFSDLPGYSWKFQGIFLSIFLCFYDVGTVQTWNTFIICNNLRVSCRKGVRCRGKEHSLWGYLVEIIPDKIVRLQYF